MTNKIYIGNTQQNFKKRMTGHFQDVKKLMEKGVHSDSYARHSPVFGQEEPQHHHQECSGTSLNATFCGKETQFWWSKLSGNPPALYYATEKGWKL
jgi:hypothetical protein